MVLKTLASGSAVLLCPRCVDGCSTGHASEASQGDVEVDDGIANDPVYSDSVLDHDLSDSDADGNNGGALDQVNAPIYASSSSEEDIQEDDGIANDPVDSAYVLQECLSDSDADGDNNDAFSQVDAHGIMQLVSASLGPSQALQSPGVSSPLSQIVVGNSICEIIDC